MKRIIPLAVMILGGLTAFGQSDSQKKKSNKMEQQQIIQTITNIFNGADERNWTKVQHGFAENVLLDFTSISGGHPSTKSSKQIVNDWEGFLPGFDKTSHQVSGFSITQNGDQANAYYHGKADHFINNEVWTVEGTYDTELQLEHNVWKITKHKFTLTKQSGNTKLPATAMEIVKSKNVRKVQFLSEGLILKGNLFLPPGFNPKNKYPAILVGGSWTTVKEQMSGLYAKELSKQGFVTLAFDPRYFGESEGQPRFWENPVAKIEDFKNAITFLQTVEGVDASNIFLTAICASSGYMANVAAQDKRVQGLATIAAWLHDKEAVELIYGGKEGVQTKIKQAQDAKRMFAENGTVTYIPAISTTDKTAAMYGPFDYYLDVNRGAVPQWSASQFAVMSWEDWLIFNPMTVAKNIQVPTLMIHSDGAVLGDYVKRFFNDIPYGNKILQWTEGTQFDFYDQPKQVNESVAAVSMFFKNNMNNHEEIR